MRQERKALEEQVADANERAAAAHAHTQDVQAQLDAARINCTASDHASSEALAGVRKQVAEVCAQRDALQEQLQALERKVAAAAAAQAQVWLRRDRTHTTADSATQQDSWRVDHWSTMTPT